MSKLCVVLQCSKMKNGDGCVRSQKRHFVVWCSVSSSIQSPQSLDSVLSSLSLSEMRKVKKGFQPFFKFLISTKRSIINLSIKNAYLQTWRRHWYLLMELYVELKGGKVHVETTTHFSSPHTLSHSHLIIWLFDSFLSNDSTLCCFSSANFQCL
jgi:hypothetical protein